MIKRGCVSGCLSVLIILVLSVLGCWFCGELIKSANGLPIDDAYIFKRYALNLASGNGFSFNPGEPSFGCSSFLWTALLAVLVKLFGPEHYVALAQWAGIILSALAVWYLLKLLFSESLSWLIIVGASFFAWFSSVTFMNAVSGMENGLFSYLVLLNFYWWHKLEAQESKNGFLMGIISALAFLARPEGIYFGLMITALTLYRFLRGKKTALVFLTTFLIGYILLAVPYLLWLQVRFHQILPYTYLAKIYTSDPTILTKPLSQKISDGFQFLVYGWWLLIKPWKLVGYILLFFALLGLIPSLIELFKKSGNFSLLVISGWLFLPFLYGFSFKITPYFGGYYQRYLSSVWLALILLSFYAMDKIYRRIFPKNLLQGCLKRMAYLIGLILAIIYCVPIVKTQVAIGKITYQKEVRLNQELRMSAANWLNQNTPPEAKILVGYTGLGVVGGGTQRYIYDLGALINLDLLPYLEGTKPMFKKRWQKILEYICDRNIDYYVNFAPTWTPDPAESPGFSEVARLGASGEPKESSEQIRIYHIDRTLLCPSLKK